MLKEKKKILVIDDEEEIRSLLETKFYKLGYNVDVAATGLQAVTKIRSGSEFDLVICDLKMPKMNGVKFFSELKSLQPKAKFLLITGHPDKNNLLGAVKNGIANILIKPVKHQEITSKVVELIGVATAEPVSA